MAYVSRSPPIIPDGQISRVRFETLAFFRRPSQVWRGLNAGSVYTPAILVCLQPRLQSCRGVTPVLSSRPPYGQVSRQVSSAPLPNFGATSVGGDESAIS